MSISDVPRCAAVPGRAIKSHHPRCARRRFTPPRLKSRHYPRAGYTKDAPYGFSEGGSVWMRRGAVVRRTLKAPGFVIPLSPRDAAWIDGMVRACRELLAHRGGDDVLESALATVERWREGQTSTRDLQETEAAVRAHRHRHPTMAVPVEHLLRVLLHREAHRGDSPEDIFTWRKRTDRGRRALVSAFVSTYGEMPDEAAAHVAAYLHERPLSF